jgi:hypothetical protein
VTEGLKVRVVMNARFAITPIPRDLAAGTVLMTWSPNASKQQLSTISAPKPVILLSARCFYFAPIAVIHALLHEAQKRPAIDRFRTKFSVRRCPCHLRGTSEACSLYCRDCFDLGWRRAVPRYATECPSTASASTATLFSFTRSLPLNEERHRDTG